MSRDDDVLQQILGLESSRSRDAREVFDDLEADVLGEIVGEVAAVHAHAFGGPWSQYRGLPTTQPWGGPEPHRGYGYPSYLNPWDVQEEPNFDESFEDTILRHTRASRGG